jgi:transposase
MATGAQPAPVAAARPDPEVASKARRRRFTAAYKLERATTPGAIGALLRREGLYSSHLAKWREHQAASLEPRRRGRKPQVNPLRARVAQLERENTRLQRELEKAQIIIEVQKSGGAVGKGRAERERLMTATAQLADRVGVRAACTALAAPRPTYYRGRRPKKEVMQLGS